MRVVGDDFWVGSRVTVKRRGDRILPGTVQYIGTTDFADGVSLQIQSQMFIHTHVLVDTNMCKTLILIQLSAQMYTVAYTQKMHMHERIHKHGNRNIHARMSVHSETTCPAAALLIFILCKLRF